MKKRQIVNIVNFIRAVEPRLPMDLIEPVREQIALMKKHGLRGTFLLQYDAMLVPEIVAMLKELDPAQFELGVWHEIVQPQVESIGIPWTGRYPWDWHAHCGFSVGYTKDQRERLCDALFEKFRELFGVYPRVFGSWFFDSHTVRYLCDTYGLDALCNCKEQYGTDGYTLWGGYYGQGYYPSRINCFMPAQTKEEQLHAPLFRMLGSDHVYQYDFGMSLEEGAKTQGVITLEPVYTNNTGGGGVPHWVDWYLRENYNGDCLSFGYAQAGQENAFGWKAMRDGLTYQFAQFEKLQSEGKIEVEPLGDTGRWFKQTYTETPASAITAHNAFDDDDKTSVWYSNQYLRINVYAEGDVVRIRDLHVFSERHPDPFENTVCESNEAVYETLPIIDGNRHTGHGILAGGYFLDADGMEIACETMQFEDLGGGSMRLTYAPITVTVHDSIIRIEGPQNFAISLRRGSADHLPIVTSQTGDCIALSYNGTAYRVQLHTGRIASDTHIDSTDGIIEAEILL
ncbi:MAG: hypothetical protein E7604_08060 [Ruminococcaceae bacterium]|nr:hypothetical protein [Oscillospiraceae bacterium]